MLSEEKSKNKSMETLKFRKICPEPQHHINWLEMQILEPAQTERCRNTGSRD